MDFSHIPVLYDEIIQNLNINPTGIYVDATLGGGGHSSGILKHLDSGRLICIDQDMDAIRNASEKFKDFKNVSLVHGNFEYLSEHLKSLNIESIDGIIADLGVSSYQLDTKERGFSYHYDNSLDMRMNQAQEFSAYHVVNSYDEEKLAKIIRDYGEERWAVRIAKFIVEARKHTPINTTFELVDIIKASIPKEVRREGSHPAKKTFQAIRIEVNGELDRIEHFIRAGVRHLKKYGIIEVITFHSLEDRIVKNTFRDLLGRCTCPPELPFCTCGRKSELKIITNKPITASKLELEYNNRSRSAKLRIAQKL